jgi:hypothetical protein
MVDATSWGSLGNTALTQGVSFLYGQAADLLRRWRDRKSSDDALIVTPADGVDQSVLAGRLRQCPVDPDAVARTFDDLLWLTEQLGSYANGIREIDSTDKALTSTTEAIRGLLELAYRQRITFCGEEREVTGSAVDVSITAQRVSGELTLARIGSIRGAVHIDIKGDIGSVDYGAQVVGIDADTIGG